MTVALGACSELANILRGTPKTKGNVCTVSLSRDDLSVTLAGISTEIPLGTAFSFQSLPGTNKTLNLGDVILLQEEVPHAFRALTEAGIIVSALHNHWLFDEPHLMYAHVQAVMDPFQFARIIAMVLRR